MRARWAVAAVLLTGCGLPLDEGVQRPGPAVERAAQPGGVDVLPPGPGADADALAVVAGFVDAQSSPKDGHAIARRFLAEGVAWDDTEARVFESRQNAVEQRSSGDTTVVTVTYRLLGQVRADQTWVSEPRTETAAYRLRRSGATWRLVEVPPGLHLSVRDRARTFRARSVHFLAAASTAGRLVAEPVFQPATAEPAQALVERLLRGPSVELAPAVRSAVPPGTRLRSRVERDGGTVVVDLDGAVQQLGEAERRQLSAQLVWTLRELEGFTTLRLRAGGAPLVVDGVLEQSRDAWDEVAPDGLPAQPPLLFAASGELRSLAAGTTAATRVPGQAPVVDDVAVSPLGELVAVLTRTAAGTVVSTGPLAGPYTRRALVGPAASPTWGSGERGLFLADRGRVRLLRLSDQAVVEVPVEGTGAVTSLAVSRDGARVALVRDGDLLVGRIELADSGLRIAGLRRVAPALGDVLDVAWADATGLAVLARRGAAPGRIPFAVEVDGSAVVADTRIGISREPTAVAAAPGQPLTVAAGGPDRPALFRESGPFFEPGPAGRVPVYPG